MKYQLIQQLSGTDTIPYGDKETNLDYLSFKCSWQPQFAQGCCHNLLKGKFEEMGVGQRCKKHKNLHERTFCPKKFSAKFVNPTKYLNMRQNSIREAIPRQLCSFFKHCLKVL